MTTAQALIKVRTVETRRSAPGICITLPYIDRIDRCPRASRHRLGHLRGHLINAVNQLATEAAMNSSARAQARWDNMQPDDDSGFEEAANRWIEDTAENLMRGCDLVIRRRGSAPIVVEYSAYLAAVQLHLNQRQIDGLDDEDMFAQLVIAAAQGASAKSLARGVLGPSDHPQGKLFDIAVELVTPHAEAGLEAEAEDADL